MTSEATISLTDDVDDERRNASTEALALLIVGFDAEPQRIGEVAFVSTPAILGRGEGGPGPRATFVRQRPGKNDKTAPLGGAGLSRDQVRVAARGRRVDVELIGRAPMTHEHADVERCSLVIGDTVTLRGQLTLMCVLRPRILARLAHFPVEAVGAFGEADRFGMFGESPSTWLMRERIAFVAQSNGHGLLLGESGTGKELAAHAVHALSTRATRAFVARNAATLPPGLIDAELFGHAKNYPTSGMVERVGIIGEADGGTLFLDEIAELSTEMQSHLLRVLDADGEYQRLGEATPRRSRFVLIGATNRPTDDLKRDFLARFPLRMSTLPLREHLEDLPHIVRHLMIRAAKKSPEIAERFLTDVEGRAFPRVHPPLLRALLAHDYPSNIRELDSILWQAMATSPGTTLTASSELLATLSAPAPATSVTPEAVRTKLASNHGNMSRTARDLGLRSRYALYRLMKKLDVDVE